MSAPTSESWLLEVRGVSKSFPGVRALADVDLKLRAGQVLGVVGENGAGKSTLMKIIGGVQRPDSGQVLLRGAPLALRSVHHAQTLGIALIHQELNLAEELDVAANVFLGREPTRCGFLKLLDRSVYDRAAALCRRIGLDVSPRTRVSRLSVGQQQLVEIARALAQDARILIMDEPTSSLTDRETERLFQVLAELRSDGVSVLYISHRLPEIQQVCDSVSVLRDGRNAGELAREEISHQALVRLMVGRDLKQFFHRGERRPPANVAPRLTARELRVPGRVRFPLSFELRPGEIVGLAGLMGAGRTELAETLAGLRRPAGGSLLLDGRPYRPASVAAAIAAGVCLVPEDRRQQGLLLAQSVKHNFSLPSLTRWRRWGLVQRGVEQAEAEAMCGRLAVRTPSVRQTVGLLSGGNQQKVVFGKWLATSPRLLILDEPTRGVDVGAKAELYAIMNQLAADGVAILMVTSDMEEALGMSDRLLVMHDGALAGELERAAFSEHAVMHLATGGGKG